LTQISGLADAAVIKNHLEYSNLIHPTQPIKLNLPGGGFAKIQAAVCLIEPGMQ